MDSQHTPGLADYLTAIRRRYRLLLGLALPIIAFAVLLAVLLPDVYRSAGLFEIATEKTPANLAVGISESEYADQYVSNLKSAVLNDENLRALLSTHELYPDRQASAADKLSRLRDDIDVEIVTAPILDPRTGREREIVSAFTVAYENRSPERARDGAAWLVNAFLSASRLDNKKRAAGAAGFFAGEAERVEAQIAQLETRLADFKNRNMGRLPELAEANVSTIERTDRDLEEVRQQERTLQRQRVFLVAQLAEARTMTQEGNLGALEEEYRRKSATYDEGHPDMIALRRQIENLKFGGAGGASLQAQLETQRSILTEARQRYSEDHPDVRRIVRHIEALQARIASGEQSGLARPVRTPAALQVQTQINAIDAQLAALGRHSAALNAKLTQVQGLVAAAPEVEREYQAVTRDIGIARAKYDELLKRRMDSEVAEAAITGGRADEFRLADPPTTPTAPAKPPRLAIALVGTVLALVIALTGTVVATGLDRTVRGARDVRDVLAVSPLVTIPDIRNSTSRRRGFVHVLAQVTASAIVVSGLYFFIHTWVAA